jgi:outer membrane protein OmpA-like peptidoglycan-associated protein
MFVRTTIGSLLRNAAVALAAVAACCGVPAALAADAKGCKDPAMFEQRIPGYQIARCAQGQDAYVFRWPGGQQSVMGLKTEVVYSVPKPADGSAPRYIAMNYANAVARIGGTMLEDPNKTSLGDRVVARLTVEGREVWVRVDSESPVVGGKWQTYRVIVVQTDAAAQVISARRMLDELQAKGYITLYVPFDTAQWVIKPEGKPVVDEIVALLKSQPDLRVSVEGHTDNQGTEASNLTLSQNRAQAVVQAVVQSGIAAARMRSVGHGQAKPIAPNDTAEGRARNRRVELVKW